MNAKARTGIGVFDAMRIHEEVAEAGAGQHFFNAAVIAAFGQPHASGFAAKDAFVLLHRREHLRADS